MSKTISELLAGTDAFDRAKMIAQVMRKREREMNEYMAQYDRGQMLLRSELAVEIVDVCEGMEEEGRPIEPASIVEALVGRIGA